MQKIRSQLLNSNMCVEAENDRRSRVLLAQAPRPSALSAHDRVRPAEDKKDTPNPALRVKEKLLAVLKIIVKD